MVPQTPAASLPGRCGPSSYPWQSPVLPHKPQGTGGPGPCLTRTPGGPLPARPGLPSPWAPPCLGASVMPSPRVGAASLDLCLVHCVYQPAGLRALCSRKHTARAAAPHPPGRPLGGPSLLPLPPTGLSGGDPRLLLKVPGTLRAPRAVHRTRGFPPILYGFPTGSELRRGGHPEWHHRTCFGKGTSLGRRASCCFKRKAACDPGRDVFLLMNMKV